jgi:hypothetical protein
MAGERIREDFEAAGLGQHVVQNYESFKAGKFKGSSQFGVRDSDRKIAAANRFGKALDAMWPGLQDAVVRVACFLEPLGEAEGKLDWPAR